MEHNKFLHVNWAFFSSCLLINKPSVLIFRNLFFMGDTLYRYLYSVLEYCNYEFDWYLWTKDGSGNEELKNLFCVQICHTYIHHDDIIKWKHFPHNCPLCGEFTGPGEFPTQRPVTRSFDVFFDLRLNKRSGKQPWGWWFETLSWSLWRQCYDTYLLCKALILISICQYCCSNWCF